MQILAGKKVNDIAMVSDEAFVLLILENIWEEMINVNIDKILLTKKMKGKQQEW